MSKRRRPPVPAVAVVVLLLLVGVGVWWWLDRPTPDEERRVSGSVETTRYQVAATISGQVAEVLVSEGDTVKAGDPLVRLDEKPLKLAVDQASAGVDAAKALVRQKQDDGTKAEVAEAKARETQAKAGLNLAKTQLGYATLKAPHDGVVVTVTTNAGQAAAPGRTLVTLSDPADVWVRAFVPEPLLGSIRVGTPVRVSADGASDVDGEITWISSEPEFTPNAVETRDQRVRLVYAFRVQLPASASGFLPGQPVDVTLP
jgi:HlyD family secretion protein